MTPQTAPSTPTVPTTKILAIGKDPSLRKLMDNFESVRKELREVYKKEFEELEKEFRSRRRQHL